MSAVSERGGDGADRVGAGAFLSGESEELFRPFGDVLHPRAGAVQGGDVVQDLVGGPQAFFCGQDLQHLLDRGRHVPGEDVRK